MRRFLPLFILFFAPLTSQAQRVLEPRHLHLLVSEGIHLILSQEYAKADSVFRLVTVEYPDHPVGYIYQAAVLQTKALDYELVLESFELDPVLEQALNKAEQLLKSDPYNAWGHFFLGTIYGYDSYARVERGDWFGGVTKGLSAVSAFREALEHDSTLYDAFAGIGTYLYWKGRKTEFLHWLPFVSDDRKEGIAMLKECWEKGTYNRFAAANSLVAIFLDAGNPYEADRFATLALQSYPSNRLFLWGKATAQERIGNFAEARETYERLLQAIVADTTENLYNELVCRLNLARVQLRLGFRAEAERELKQIMEMKKKKRFVKHLSRRAATKFAEAESLLISLTSEPGR
ncbi:MAG TPA: tetratricopeptide repeat protein [Bacteroidota bacterium]|nr:tetratricopeptide repeat protein [Bacteroidota bacterium]